MYITMKFIIKITGVIIMVYFINIEPIRIRMMIFIIKIKLILEKIKFKVFYLINYFVHLFDFKKFVNYFIFGYSVLVRSLLI
jgi:hypothetical protein